MARVARVTRVANPRRGRGKVRVAAKRRNPRHRRRTLTAKQIRFFGTKAQKAALKRRRKHSKRTVVANPRRRRAAARRTKPVRRRRVARKVAANPRRRRAPVVHRRRRRRAVSNPALVVTLGAVNPKRRKTYMAKRKRKSNPRRRYAARKRNTSVRAVSRHRRRRVMNRRRNPMPSFFGGAGTKGLGMALGGGLLGVAAAKLLPTFVPKDMIGNKWLKVVATGAAAYAAGTLAGKWNKTFGDAVLFGGLMQTGSMVINALAPGFTVGGVPLAFAGMGELVPGSYPVPQNPLRISAPAPTQARVTMNGLARAYGVAL